MRSAKPTSFFLNQLRFRRRPASAWTQPLFLGIGDILANGATPALHFTLKQHIRRIDLRLVCARAEDYASPIEPSATGCQKIARAIWGKLSSETGGIGCGTPEGLRPFGQPAYVSRARS